MKQNVKKVINDSFDDLSDEMGWSGEIGDAIDISTPKDIKFGDFSCNVAMILASRHKTKPREIAEKLSERIRENELFSSVSVAGPGFINMTIKPIHWVERLKEILDADESFGCVDTGESKKVLVEFVSANPTGPLHIGHGRGAVVGDTLARIMRKAGYDVHTEYYINDVGLQMDNLGRSTIARSLEALGENFDEPPYKGDYIKDIAQLFLKTKDADLFSKSDDKLVEEARDFTASRIMDDIRADLKEFRIEFDEWFSEMSLHANGEVEKTIEILKENNHIYESDGALWLKTESAGDEKDRVVRRANGVTTYLASDIAYHKNKFDRNFDTVINVWGADHHGYVPRMKAVVKALGHDPSRLVIRLVQLVSLKKSGQSLAMSTRAGVFTTLREIMDEVGVDATRYFFLMRSSDSQLEFDVDLAKKQSSENPVFYVQYAHARCCNIFVTAEERKIDLALLDKNIDLSLLEGGDELALIRKLLELPNVVESCAISLQPHPVTQYLTDVSALFHYFYRHNRVVTDDPALTRARLFLTKAVRIVLRNGLDILGVNAPERM
ncbi:Arginyl-tRNA synthetase [hydrothermal vent metagenome]|uniref:arginine--tRNA ligase n=1 Tax=hydrothermal vent metagenome TaxID=652676 RepID=A0A3B1BMD9_9ZZZZ